jgi:transposase
MAGKTKEMSQIKQMLLLKKQGVSNRKIAKAIGMNKETVNNYIRKANADTLGIDGLLKLEDPELEYRLKGGTPAYTDERFDKFKELLPYLESEMQRKHVTLRLLWEEYKQDTPDGYSLTQFRYHYRQNVTARKDNKPSTVMKDLYVGGEKMFLDYAGDTLGYVDVETGEIIKVQSFVACLPASDYGFMICVPSQRTDDFVYACIQCFKALGGVPHILVPDNLKAAVVKSDRYTPAINKVMEDMANHYGTVVIPARPVHPKDKSGAEDLVKIVYRRVYAELRNETFYSLKELNDAVARKMQAHNQKRMQQHPYSREERFLAIEKPNLLPLPKTDFEIRYYADLKVEQNCCVYLGRDKHYYSVPYQYVGQKAHVIYTRTLVKVFIDGNLVCTHRRDFSPGQYTIVREHLASNSQAYRDRSPETYISKGYRIMQELGEILKKIFYTSQMPPETHYRTCNALIALQRRTDPDIFRKACSTALECGRYNYGFISRLVETRCAATGRPTAVKAPPQHGNIRGREQFQ